MAGQIPSFLSGSRLSIKIGETVIAYAQNLSFSDNMTVQPVGQIGSYGFQTLEPTGYIARGTMTVTNYSDQILNRLQQINENAVVGNLRQTDSSANAAQQGNSLLVKEFFSPLDLILSRTFDLEVYQRNPEQADGGGFEVNNFGNLIYVIQNCRMANYSIGFTPGSLVNETISFISVGVQDVRAGEISKQGG